MKKRTFAAQLTRSYLVIAILPSFCIMAILFVYSVATTTSAQRERVDMDNKLISSQCNALIDNMSFISLDLLSDSTFVDAAVMLTYGLDDGARQQKAYSSITERISTYALAASSYDVTFINENRGYVATSKEYNKDWSLQKRLTGDQIQGLPWLEQVKNNGGAPVLLPIQPSTIGPESDEFVLTLVRSIRIPTTIVGYILIEVDASELYTIMNIGNQDDTEIAIVYDGKTVISQSEMFPCEGECDENVLKKLEKQYMVAASCDVENKITVFSVIMERNICHLILTSISPVYLSLVLLIILTVVSIRLLAKQISRPIVLLTQEMKGTTLENLTLDYHNKIFENCEEIQYLHDQFDLMRQRLDTTINNEISAKTLQIREHLKSLQSQINPHFLYNTLSVIGIMGMEDGSQRVYDACSSMSSVFRYSIADKNREYATIWEEIDHAESYLKLMRIRFEHRFRYQIYCDPKVAHVQTPRLILQPFIENIFEHAYDAKHTVVSATISADFREGRWIITIEDDGAGMSEQTVSSLCARVDSNVIGNNDDYYNSIGIVNTLLRLKLHGFEDFTYCIRNKNEGGVRIVFSAAMQNKEGDNGSH